MDTLTVAGVQMETSSDVAANRDRILHHLARAAAEGAEILLTPEGALSGYTHEFDQAQVDVALEAVVERAASLGIGLALGTCFYEADARCYNQIRFYDRRGAYLGSHAKILRCGTATVPTRGEIGWYATHELRTFSFEGWTVAGLVCNDLWANPAATPMPDPNLVLQAARAGATVIFHAVNGTRDATPLSDLVRQFHEANLRMRALAAGVHVVTVDNATPVTLPCSSPGGVVGPDGAWITRTGWTGEELFVTAISAPRRHDGTRGGT